jgi:hypothetical protein
MVEQVINEQNMDVSEAHTPATNKRRKAEDGALEDSSDSMGFISGVVQSLKKPRISSKAPGGTGYAGNLTEDVGIFSALGSASFSDIGSTAKWSVASICRSAG